MVASKQQSSNGCGCEPNHFGRVSEMSTVPGTTSRAASKEHSEEYRSPYIDYMKLVGTPAEFKLVVGMSRLDASIQVARSHSTPLIASGDHVCAGMVGLPARGKSYIARKLAYYLNWCGVKTRGVCSTHMLPLLGVLMDL